MMSRHVEGMGVDIYRGWGHSHQHGLFRCNSDAGSEASNIYSSTRCNHQNRPFEQPVGSSAVTYTLLRTPFGQAEVAVLTWVDHFSPALPCPAYLPGMAARELHTLGSAT